MALISLEHVTKIYPKGSRPALDDISLHIDRGDFVFLVGASGSGKTTLLSLLIREEEATDGEIRVAGNDLRRLTNRQVPQYRRSIGFVFQDYKLLNNKTVWQNVAFALEVIGTKRSTIRSLVPKVLDTVGLTGKEKNYPHELSGGEQQRVAIARAYVNHPQILLADEPTGNLDPTTSLGIMEVLDAINRTGTTIVMATHNEEIVNSMRKRVVELHNGTIVRDEAQGSYDSALYFPDAEVESKAQRSLGVGDANARFRADVPSAAHIDAAAITDEDRDQAAAQAVEAVALAMNSGSGDDGIARLAKSMHSGRTGRYGEAFVPVETTLTWGRGLSLDEMSKQEQQKEEASETGVSTATSTTTPTTTGVASAADTADTDDESSSAHAKYKAPRPAASVADNTPSSAQADTKSENNTDDSSTQNEVPAPPMPPVPPAPPSMGTPGKDDTATEGDEQ